MKESVERMLPKTVLVEADLFISYLTADPLKPFFHIVVEEAKKA